jgi:two-component system, chemotaxis family, chemotaxis protein CheY
MSDVGALILVVDDDHDIRDAVAELLRESGYEVVVARNGAEAHDLLQVGPLPSVILLDLMMPEADALEFRTRQLQDPRVADIPVVLLSASSRTVESAQAMGVAGYLKKPFGADNLLATVEKLRIKVAPGA